MLFVRRLVAVLSLLLACGAVHAQLTIGVVLAATGPNSAVGVPGKNTAEILPTTIAGQKVRYVVMDDATDPGVAVKNARKLVQEDSVDAIIGSSSTPACLAINEVAQDSGTPQVCVAPIGFRNPWVFSTAQPVPLMVAGIVEHMKSRGIKSVAYIGYSDGWGDLNYDALAKLAADAGIKVLANERYARADTSVGGQVLRLLSTNPEAVFVGASGAPAALPSTTLVERGYRGQVYHTHGVIAEAFLRVGGKALDGVVAPTGPFVVAEQLPDANPIKKIALDYAKLYEAKYGAGSRSIFGANVWDAYTLINAAVPVALQKAKPGTREFRQALRDALESRKDVAGAGAIYSFTPADHNGVDQRARVMVQVRGGEFKLIDPSAK